MSITLRIATDATDHVCVKSDISELARTPYAQLPAIGSDSLSKAGDMLFAALGGNALCELLDADPDQQLLLAIAPDDKAEALAWEYATLPTTGRPLVARYACLRLVEKNAHTTPASSENLRLVALTANPLVQLDDNDQLQPFDAPLNSNSELRAIDNTLAELPACGLVSERILPTQTALRTALQSGQVILHLSGHGVPMAGKNGRAETGLLLEDECGCATRLASSNLATLPGRGLRLVFLSACNSAAPAQPTANSTLPVLPSFNIAQHMVQSGVPAAIGFAAPLPEHLSGGLASTFYNSYLQGNTLGEALRQLRNALSQNDPALVGAALGYVASGALDWRWQAHTPNKTSKLTQPPGQCNFPSAVQAPKPLLGRARDLHQLAYLFLAQQAQVVNIGGAGGMGKTALAASFAERFAAYWRDGVFAISFANDANPDDGWVRQRLAQAHPTTINPQDFARETAEQQVTRLLAAFAAWDGVLLVDNYETVQYALAENRAAAQAIHALFWQLATQGCRLLLTTRERPAELPHETNLHGQAALAGLTERDGATLFLRYAERAKDEGKTGQQLAHQLATSTAGHPLALQLLAADYNKSHQSAADFYRDWENRLNAAQQHGSNAHHRSLSVALAKSLAHLDPAERALFDALATLSFPFMAQAVIALQHAEQLATVDPYDGLFTETAALDAAQRSLNVLTRAHLLEASTVDAASFTSWRMHPALRPASQAHHTQPQALAAYLNWLVANGRLKLSQDEHWAAHLQQALPNLPNWGNALPTAQQGWYHARLGAVQSHFGSHAAALHSFELAEQQADPDSSLLSFTLHAKANILRLQGDLPGALTLYDQSLAIDEKLGDIKGRSATLHEKANILTLQGDLPGALTLYDQSLAIKDKLGDIQGRATTQAMVAQLRFALGEPAAALALLHASLSTFQKLGMPRETQQVNEFIEEIRTALQAADTPTPRDTP